ncbi:possible Phycobilisome polypeptide [Synechococcus sp. CC9311]|nr:possible Phycobilisome polypeptide [Synechococcus sp. CC9311]
MHKSSLILEKNQKILDLANREKRLLSTIELNSLCEQSRCDSIKLEELQHRLPELINNAKETLIRKIPNITEPGGSLYPKERAEACWRDCFHFARISIYGTAAGYTNITDKEGVKAIQELYKILEVPIDALIICLKELQENCKKVYSERKEKKDLKLLDGCFNHLVEKIECIK